MTAAGLAGAGCSAVLGVDADRFVAPDAGGDAGAYAGADAGADAGDDASKAELLAWGCLNGPGQTVDPNAQVSVTLTVIDPIQMSETGNAADGGSDLVTVSGAWIPDIGVRNCNLLDTTCQFGPALPTLTDAVGKASFVLEDNFLGYFELSKPDLVPARLYPGHLLAGHRNDELPAFGLTPAELTDLVKATSAKVLDDDAGVGVAVVTIYDCQDHQAPQISVSFTHLGPDSLPFYFRGGLPNPLATSTDNFGLAGAINVPPGTEMVTAWRTSDQSVIGSATFDVLPGTISSVFIRVRTQ